MDPTRVHCETKRTSSPTRCCPRFDPERYRDRELHWKQERFVKEEIACLFHVPIQLGMKVKRANLRIDAASAQPSEPLTLIDETSAWGADLYLRVTKNVPGTTTTKLDGTYVTRVFQGPYCDAQHWAHEMRRFVEARGQKLEHVYFHYPTCPACATAYGASHAVLFARVSGRSPR